MIEHYCCKRCGLVYSTNEEKPTCTKGPCPMEQIPEDEVGWRDIEYHLNQTILEELNKEWKKQFGGDYAYENYLRRDDVS